jgi:hypothetical protein
MAQNPKDGARRLQHLAGMEPIYWMAAIAVIASVIAFTMKRKRRARK